MTAPLLLGVELDNMRHGHSCPKPGAVLFGEPWLRADQNGLIMANTYRRRDSAARMAVQLKHRLQIAGCRTHGPLV